MPPEKLASATTTTATWPSRYHADAAHLCTLCDSSVHSANPPARRHHRAPLLPIAAGVLISGGLSVARPKEEDDDKDCFFIEGEVDQYFNLVEFSTSCEEEEGKENFECREEEEEKQMLQSSFNLESEDGFKDGIDYSVFLPHTESMSSVEATVVPENSISSSEFGTSKGTIELFSGPPIQVAQQFTAMDREARVLRYREKRKTRKFQKIIRYASRKAYAETRPRIKGRFAKRTDAELEVDQMFAAPVMVEAGYGVVHSY